MFVPSDVETAPVDDDTVTVLADVKPFCGGGLNVRRAADHDATSWIALSRAPPEQERQQTCADTDAVFVPFSVDVVVTGPRNGARAQVAGSHHTEEPPCKVESFQAITRTMVEQPKGIRFQC